MHGAAVVDSQRAVPLDGRSFMGLLRPAFADGAKVKVFHGANMDILWLQVRDRFTGELCV